MQPQFQSQYPSTAMPTQAFAHQKQPSTSGILPVGTGGTASPQYPQIQQPNQTQQKQSVEPQQHIQYPSNPQMWQQHNVCFFTSSKVSLL